MAKYIEVPSSGIFTYALDECEDYVLLDSYLHVRQSGRFATAKHLKIFEFYHLQEGGTLNDNILMQLNSSLRSLGRPGLMFVNGHTTSFAALRGQDKVMRRQGILDRIGGLPATARDELIRRKKSEAASLPERQGGLPQRAPAPADTLTRHETERRRKALADAQKADLHRSPSRPAELIVPPDEPEAAEPNSVEGSFVPESTVQDNVVELITEMRDLKQEVAALKAILQSVFKNV